MKRDGGSGKVSGGGPAPYRRWRPAQIWWLAGGGLALAFLVMGLVIFWPRDPYALPRGDWHLFKQRFLAPEGRVVDTGNGDVSHSEGQGYGMLLAVAYDDRRAFDAMWNWTQEHLRRADDSLFSWRYEPIDGGQVNDSNNASDGDLLIAWALLRGFQQWGDFDYQRDAAQIIADFLKLAVVETRIGIQMLPGLAGFQSEAGFKLNPSYYVFPAIAELGVAFPSERWAELAKGGETLLTDARFGDWRLNPNWALLEEEAIVPAPDREPLFGYDAIRVPLHVFWQDGNSELLEPYAAYWRQLPTNQPIPSTLNLETNEPGPHPMLPGMEAVARTTMAVAADERMTVRDVPRLTRDEPYYSASLKLLTKLAIRDGKRAE